MQGAALQAAKEKIRPLASPRRLRGDLGRQAFAHHLEAGRGLKFLTLACLLVAVLLTTSAAFASSPKGRSAAAASASGPQQSSPASTWQPPSGATYVGSDTCQTCHAEIHKGFMESPHWATTKESHVTQGAHGCESCHGPGSAHVAAGGDPTKIFRFTTAKAEEISRRCLTCHEANEEQRQFLRSTHFESGISCTSCHSIHSSKRQYLLVAQQANLCFSCHQEKRADFQMPFRHRVLEGLISCSDCHNPHGTVAGRQIRTTPDQDAICLKCHMDKRGPFVYEHVSVRVEGCTTCHFPHGSTNGRMLTTARVNSLCLQCHAGPPGPHNQSGKAQTCILCHSQIHGSNLDSLFFK
jgi:DmsE family decaheme c-type cytochrome